MVALAKIANKLFVINKRKGGLYFIVLMMINVLFILELNILFKICHKYSK